MEKREDFDYLEGREKREASTAVGFAFLVYTLYVGCKVTFQLCHLFGYFIRHMECTYVFFYILFYLFIYEKIITIIKISMY